MIVGIIMRIPDILQQYFNMKYIQTVSKVTGMAINLVIIWLIAKHFAGESKEDTSFNSPCKIIGVLLEFEPGPDRWLVLAN